MFNIVRSKSIFRNNIVHLPVLFLLIVALFTGVWGVDFGTHWDESGIINSVTHSIETGTLLPRHYNYPSLCYNLVLLGFLPKAIPVSLDINIIKKLINNKLSGVSYKTQLSKIQEKLIIILKSYQFKLYTRSIFILVSYLSLFWVYFLVLVWRRSRIESLLASSLIGLSWEVAYHARWIVPDVIMMQFATFTLMCLFFAQNNKNAKLWLTLSIIGAGLASGTKYPGGLLILPVLLAIYYNFRTNSAERFSLYIPIKTLLIFALVNLVVTPGTLLDPVRFFRDVLFIIQHYIVTGSTQHLVTPGIKHLLLILNYFFTSVFSKYTIIASVFFAMAIIGIISMVKNEKKTAVMFLCFPCLYILCMSYCKVMIVRNLIVLIPFFAILASRGCIILHSKFKHRSWQVLFSISIVVLLLINAFWLFKAAKSIRIKSSANYIEQVASYIDQRPDILFLVSKPVANDLLYFDSKIRSNITQFFSYKTKAAIFYASEVNKQGGRWKANKFNYTWIWFGPYEVNFNYYPTWLGDDRIVVMPIKSALDLGIFSTN